MRAAPIGSGLCGVSVLILSLAGWPGVGGAEQDAAALPRACAGGDDDACAELVHALKFLDLPARIRTQAAATLGRRCRAAGPEACARLGDDLLRGGGIVGEPVRRRAAIEALVWACARREVGACLLLADHFRAGDETTPADPGRGLVYLGRACDLGDGGSCAALADHVRDGRSVRRDPRRALALRRRACRAGHQPACLTLDERSCAAGDEPACARLATASAGRCTRTCAEPCEHVNLGGGRRCCRWDDPCEHQRAEQRRALERAASEAAGACARRLDLENFAIGATVTLAVTGFVLGTRFAPGEAPPGARECLRQALAGQRLPGAHETNEHQVVFRPRAR